MIKNNKAGISLIVLIITVIVMVILASATVITLNEANIIRNSKDAVKKVDLQTAQHMATLIWTDATLDNVANIGEEYIRTELIKQNIDVADYLIKVTEDGVKITINNEPWIQIYTGTTSTTAGGIILGDTAMFDSLHEYRITLEGEEFKGSIIARPLFYSGHYFFSVLLNGTSQSISAIEQAKSQLANLPNDAVIVIGIQDLDDEGAETTALGFIDKEFKPASSEYKVTKIEKRKSGTLIFDGRIENKDHEIEFEDLSITRDYVVIIEYNGKDYTLSPAGTTFWADPSVFLAYVTDPIGILLQNGRFHKFFFDDIAIKQIYDIGESTHVKVEGDFVIGRDGILIGTPLKGEYTFPETVAGIKLEKIYLNCLRGTPILDRYIELQPSDDVVGADKLIIKKEAEALVYDIGEKTTDLRVLDVTDCGDAVQLSELTLTNIGTIYVTMNAKINLYSAYSNVVGV